MITGRRPGRPPKTIRFDHSAPVTQVVDKRGRYLLQNGHKFTFAEYNKFTKKWEPEPESLDIQEFNTLSVLPVLEDIQKSLNKINKDIEEVLPRLKQMLSSED